MQALERETLILNMGPQHPSTHGVLRLVLELEGETVVGCQPVIGYLHTGIERNMEGRTYHQNIALVDRIEYLSSFFEEQAYCQAVERLMDLEVPIRALRIRDILCELERISSHLMWLATSAVDVNVTSGLMYGLTLRERILDLKEAVSGQRMMPGYLRVGGLQWDLPEGWTDEVRGFLDGFPRAVDEIAALLTDNIIWRERNEGVAVLPREAAIAFSCTGPVARASGVAYDVRRAFPYGTYAEYAFDVPVRTGGDAMDRYLVRLDEMRESRRIILQALDRLEPGPIITDDRKVAFPPRHELTESMEAVIHQFKLASESFHPPRGEVYAAVESARGEKGYYIVSDGSNRPVRCRNRAPSFSNVQALPTMVIGGLVADVVVAIASIDIVLGDIDR